MDQLQVTPIQCHSGWSTVSAKWLFLCQAKLQTYWLYKLYVLWAMFHWSAKQKIWLIRYTCICLKALETFSNCQRPVFSHGVHVSKHNMHKITNLLKFELNWLSKLRENNERKKHLCCTNCVLSDAQIWDLSWCEGSNSIQMLKWENTSFSKTKLLQRELFLTMIYTINSSPLLVTK